MGPTPGVVIIRRTRSSSRACCRTRFSNPFNSRSRPACAASSAFAMIASVGWPSTSSWTRAKAVRVRRSNFQPEATQYAAQAHLDVEQLRLHQLARGQKRAHFLRRHRLAMNRTEPTQPHQLRDSARVITVALDRHRLEGVMHMTGLQQFHRQAFFPSPHIAIATMGPPPARCAQLQPSPRNQPIRFSGSLTTFASRTILPPASTTQILEASSETSIPA